MFGRIVPPQICGLCGSEMREGYTTCPHCAGHWKWFHGGMAKLVMMIGSALFVWGVILVFMGFAPENAGDTQTGVIFLILGTVTYWVGKAITAGHKILWYRR